MANKKPERMSFEESVVELESIVNDLEQGSLPLDQAMKQFERGIALAGESHQKLQQAEQQIKILKQGSPSAPLQDFNPESSS